MRATEVLSFLDVMNASQSVPRIQYYIVAALQISVPQTETTQSQVSHTLTVKQTCERRLCAVCA